MCAIALAGCGDKKADCAGIAKHTAALQTAELEQKGAADVELEKKMIPIGEATVRDRCQKERWSQVKIDCTQHARTMAEVGQCK